MKEVLQRVEVAESDRPVRIEALPVVQRVAVVTEDWRPSQQRARVAQRQGEIPGQYADAGLRDLIHVGRRKKPDAHVVQPKLGKRLLADPAFRPFRYLETLHE